MPLLWSSLPGVGRPHVDPGPAQHETSNPARPGREQRLDDPRVCRRTAGVHVGPAPSTSILPCPITSSRASGGPRPSTRSWARRTVTRTLKNALASGRIGHAFLFSGARGVGKTTTARILAKALNCSQGDGPTAEPVRRVRRPAWRSRAGTSLDVQEIDGATNNGVEQVRELRESARYNPARDRFKIWIIDEVHMLSTGAFNALLKTLEEPPPRVKFIFATTEYHKIPDTILSRCQQYDFRMIPARELLAHLRQVADGEKIQVSDEALARIARAAEGSARDALSLFDQVLSFSGNEVKDEDVAGAPRPHRPRAAPARVSAAVVDGDSLALLELVERLSDYGADYRNFARELLLHFREILLLKLAPDGERASWPPSCPRSASACGRSAEAFSEEDLLRIFDVLTQAETDLRSGPGPAGHPGAGAPQAGADAAADAVRGARGPRRAAGRRAARRRRGGRARPRRRPRPAPRRSGAGRDDPASARARPPPRRPRARRRRAPLRPRPARLGARRPPGRAWSRPAQARPSLAPAAARRHGPARGRRPGARGAPRLRGLRARCTSTSTATSRRRPPAGTPQDPDRVRAAAGAPSPRRPVRRKR